MINHISIKPIDLLYLVLDSIAKQDTLIEQETDHNSNSIWQIYPSLLTALQVLQWQSCHFWYYPEVFICLVHIMEL